MKLGELDGAVKRNIVKLLTAFYEHPAIFLSEADVQCYLCSLLVNDPIFMDNCPIIKEETPKKESKTFLIHAELGVDTRRGSKRVDISIIKPRKMLSFSNLIGAIGIEIKYNRRIPAGKEPSSILEDVKKVAQAYQKGYILWLNWDREIDDDHIKKVEKRVNKYGNVTLFYLDLFSDPMKTNVKEFSEFLTS